MSTAILLAAVMVGGTGIVIGILLGLAGKAFHVETDPREAAIREELPGNNCGGCGYPGCDGMAAAIAKDTIFFIFVLLSNLSICRIAFRRTNASVCGCNVVLMLSLYKPCLYLSNI